ncbi:nuclear transport factor 2 family protein [Conexibacter sp. SYSU D00693]|uniref:nuclear transport factor 2 family protein n=1 Tax=Conexibacter sp. SYSU D00693 TaxID=2812560 RepID=UPI00196A422C|nr:nuclear transport factor 2 family protein [Conexibacter sp. SYSU D00693]
MDERQAFLGTFAARWLDAWNSHETERVLDLLSDDVVWDDRTFWPEVLHGKDAVREYVERIWQAMPDVQFEERGRFFDPDGERAIFLFRQWGSAPARFADHPGFDSHGCDIFLAFDGDRLAHYQAAYDMVEMMRQMELLPPREGKVGGAYFLSLLGGVAS